MEVNTSFKPGGIGAEGKGIEEKNSSSATSRSETQTFVAVKAAIDGLLKANRTLVIDDFHYLPPETQTAIIRGLKQAVFDGLRVVLLLIPHRLHQAVAAEIDVDGRSEAIVVPEWDDKELFSIAETGFRVLNVKALATDIDALVKESFKSPHLMQDFCSRLCADNHVWKTETTLRASNKIE